MIHLLTVAGRDQRGAVLDDLIFVNRTLSGSQLPAAKSLTYFQLQRLARLIKC